MDKIICTQDLAGERQWLNQQFPGYTNLETEFGGKWPDNKLNPGDNNYIWEIPVDSAIDLDSIDQEKILSLYSKDQPFASSRWCKTNQLVSQVPFETGLLKNSAIVITQSRCGTVFLEKMIYDNHGYKESHDRVEFPNYGYKKLHNHAMLFDPNINAKISELCQLHQPDVFVVYRNDLWNWFTSSMIANRTVGLDPDRPKSRVHSYNQQVLDNLDPFEVDPAEIRTYQNLLFVNWNNICHMRSQFNHLNFFVIEFSYLIQTVAQRYDSKIDYNKKTFIKNHDELETIFHNEHLNLMQTYQNNAVRHLESMKCYTNLSRLLELPTS